MSPPGFLEHVPFLGRVVVVVLQHLCNGVSGSGGGLGSQGMAQLLNWWPRSQSQGGMTSFSVLWSCEAGSTDRNDGPLPSFGACLEMGECQELSLGRGKCRDGVRGMEKHQAEVARGGWCLWSILMVRV